MLNAKLHLKGYLNKSGLILLVSLQCLILNNINWFVVTELIHNKIQEFLYNKTTKIKLFLLFLLTKVTRALKVCFLKIF